MSVLSPEGFVIDWSYSSVGGRVELVIFSILSFLVVFSLSFCFVHDVNKHEETIINVIIDDPILIDMI